MAERNRISPLVYHGLISANVAPPTDVAWHLSQRAAVAARRGLATARESLRLQREFEAAGMRSMILKGAPLSLLAYGDLGMKESVDVDLLVSIESVPRAIELLGSLGYRSDLSSLKRVQLDGYVRHCKEAPFLLAGTGLMVDLHWRLVDNGMLPNVGLDGPEQEVPVPGGRLRTLAREELFVYLCVHGILHNWARLKWIADIGALVNKLRHDEIDRYLFVAERHGAARAASVALAVCHRLLGIEPSKRLRANLRQDCVVPVLQANALAGLGYMGGAVEPDRYSSVRLRKIAAQFFAAPGPAHLLNQARFYWNVPIDRMRIPLPPSLEFLYGVFRIPLWLARFAARTFGRRQAPFE